jgi:hypothetical protein
MSKIFGYLTLLCQGLETFFLLKLPQCSAPTQKFRIWNIIQARKQTCDGLRFMLPKIIALNYSSYFIRLIKQRKA